MSDVANAIVWIHGDCLSPQNPALTRYPAAPAVFVFDDVVVEGYGLTLKRLLFLYECLLELPVEIRRGDVAAEVLDFAMAYGAGRIISTWTPAPRFQQIVDALRERRVEVEITQTEPFVELEGSVDLTRFSRYWRRAERKLVTTSKNAPMLPGFEDAR